MAIETVKHPSKIKGLYFEVLKVGSNKWLKIIHEKSGLPITNFTSAPVNGVTKLMKLSDEILAKENWDIPEEELTEEHGKLIKELKKHVVRSEYGGGNYEVKYAEGGEISSKEEYQSARDKYNQLTGIYEDAAEDGTSQEKLMEMSKEISHLEAEINKYERSDEPEFPVMETEKEIAEKMFTDLTDDSYTIFPNTDEYQISVIAINRMMKDGLLEHDSDEGENYYWFNEKGLEEVKSATELQDNYMYGLANSDDSETPYLRGYEVGEFAAGGKITLPEKGTPNWHQLQIAKSTMKLSEVGAMMLGGMNHEEAKKILDKYHIKYAKGGEDDSYVAIEVKDGIWIPITRPTTKEKATTMANFENDRETRVVTEEQFNAHGKKLSYAEGGNVEKEGWRKYFDKQESFELGTPVIYHSNKFNGRREESGEVVMNSEIYRDVYGTRVTYQPKTVKGISLYPDENYSGSGERFVVPNWNNVETFSLANKRKDAGKEFKITEHKYAEGGNIGFNKLAKKVAKQYEGKPVPKEYQEDYGKRYDHDDALTVGRKVAAKVYFHQKGMKFGAGGMIKFNLEDLLNMSIDFIIDFLHKYGATRLTKNRFELNGAIYKVEGLGRLTDTEKGKLFEKATFNIVNEATKEEVGKVEFEPDEMEFEFNIHNINLNVEEKRKFASGGKVDKEVTYRVHPVKVLTTQDDIILFEETAPENEPETARKNAVAAAVKFSKEYKDGTAVYMDKWLHIASCKDGKIVYLRDGKFAEGGVIDLKDYPLLDQSDIDFYEETANKWESEIGVMGLRQHFLQMAMADESEQDEKGKQIAKLLRAIAKKHLDAQPRMFAKGGDIEKDRLHFIAVVQAIKRNHKHMLETDPDSFYDRFADSSASFDTVPNSNKKLILVKLKGLYYGAWDGELQVGYVIPLYSTGAIVPKIFAEGGGIDVDAVTFESELYGEVDAYESVEQKDRYYYVIENPMGKGYIVIAEVKGFPSTEAWDDWFENKDDAMKVAKLLAEDKDPMEGQFAEGGEIKSHSKNNVLEVEIDGEKYKGWFPSARNLDPIYKKKLIESGNWIVKIENSGGYNTRDFEIEGGLKYSDYETNKGFLSFPEARAIIIEKAKEYATKQFAEGGKVDYDKHYSSEPITRESFGKLKHMLNNAGFSHYKNTPENEFKHGNRGDVAVVANSMVIVSHYSPTDHRF